MLDWCSSSTDSLNNTSGFIIEDQSVVSLFLVFCLISIIGLVFHSRLTEKVTRLSRDGCNLHFTKGLFSLVMLVIFSLGNLSVSSLSCRPIEMLHDPAHLLDLSSQLLGFLTSIQGAYALGYVLIPLIDRNRTDSGINRNHMACFRSVKRLTSH